MDLLNIGSWNVEEGSSLRESRDFIDNVSSKHGIHLLALQETNFSSNFYRTSNYKWYLSPKRISYLNQPGVIRRGVGLLVSIQPGFLLLRIERISDQLLYSVLRTPIGVIRVISVHIPSNYSDFKSVYNDLRNTLHKISYKHMSEVIIIGICNGRIGKNVIDVPIYEGLIGNCLHHPTCDSAGQHLLSFICHFRLQICTTFCEHSARINSSDAHHIIICKQSRIFINAINVLRVIVIDQLENDHYLLLSTISKKRDFDDQNYEHRNRNV